MFKKIKQIFNPDPPASPFVDIQIPEPAKEAAPKAAPEKEAPVIDADAKPKAKRAPRKKKEPEGKSAKDIATEKGEPYVSVLSVEIDPENVHDGAFELDWNDKFITTLVRAGYQGKTDADIVDRWFQDVCRNIVLENFEQWDANYATQRRVERQDLGGGRSEVS